MLIDFNTMKKITVPGMNNGTGSMTAKMYVDEQGKIIPFFGGQKSCFQEISHYSKRYFVL